MNFRFFNGKLSRDYAWELNLLYKLRDFKDGIDFFKLEIETDAFPSDHNPQFNFLLEVCNFVIFHFTIYNVWHEDNPNSPYYEDNEGY